MASAQCTKYWVWSAFVTVMVACLGIGCGAVYAQVAPGAERLGPVEVEPPAEEQTERQISSRTGEPIQGFGYDRSIPAGMPFSDYSLTPTEVVSPTRGTANLAKVHSAVTVHDNRGISSVGKAGLPGLIQDTPGLWTSSFSGNLFDAAIALRGFSNESPNRVSLLVNGRSLNVPRTEHNTSFVMPEMIERVEVIRGDATVPFGNKSIGGAVNVILKKPRRNPGVYAGLEAGSWFTDREWSAVNYVQGPVAAGIFLGRYHQKGRRIYEGNGIDAEPIPRPGPWGLNNVWASLNWKITPRLTVDVAHFISDQRLGEYNSISPARWSRRDTRAVTSSSWGGRDFDDFPQERWDVMTIGSLLFEGSGLGRFELIGSRRCYDRAIRKFVTWGSGTDVRWNDFGLSLQYSRNDTWAFVENDLTIGSDLYDGKLVSENREYTPGTYPAVNALTHDQQVSGYRESLSYYFINTTTLWDRLVLGLGYRLENYDLKDVYANDSNRDVVASARIDREKSASEWSLGFIYDRELGSNVYYKHARTYRFPHFDDMVNLGITGHPDPIWWLNPEEGALEEVSIRHWFTRNIYVGATYYELDMDNEIYFRNNDVDLGGFYAGRNRNIPGVSHTGVELEALVRITPKWTVKGNYTRQEVLFKANLEPDDPDGRTTYDNWLTLNPADMGHVSLGYENREWGFAASASYHYLGSRWATNDNFNELQELAPAKWGDIAVSQQFFDGLATLYAGVNNVSDAQNAVQGIRDDYAGPTPEIWRWPNAGRTYYGGVRTAMDFERMRLPTTTDLDRMTRRLYSGVQSGRDRMSAMGGWARGLLPF